jgi:hypothetical protein
LIFVLRINPLTPINSLLAGHFGSGSSGSASSSIVALPIGIAAIAVRLGSSLGQILMFGCCFAATLALAISQALKVVWVVLIAIAADVMNNASIIRLCASNAAIGSPTILVGWVVLAFKSFGSLALMFC